MNVLNTPSEFLDFSIINYPSGNNKKNFEAYFYEYFKKNNINSKYTYIPIQWTNYLVKNNYGRDIDDLKIFLNKNLESNKKYFTIVQYAGGPLVDLENTLIFSMGGAFDTSIPKTSQLISLPLIYDLDDTITQQPTDKKYIASYIGRPTHKIRVELERKLKSESSYFIQNLESMNSNISLENQMLFNKTMSKSYFSLCPRGYGPTSFRLYESIAAGVVPVYISDSHFLPFTDIVNWKDFSLILKPRKINKLKKILQSSIEEGDYKNLSKNLQKIKHYFNFSYLSKYIVSKVV